MTSTGQTLLGNACSCGYYSLVMSLQTGPKTGGDGREQVNRYVFRRLGATIANHGSYKFFDNPFRG